MKKPDYWEESIDFLQNNDKKLAQIINKYSESVLIGRSNPLETLIRSVVGQQISVKAAASVWQKMINLIGELNVDNIFLVDQEELKSCGLSKQKTQYILNIAEHFKAHNINGESYWDNREFSNIYDELITIKGVGPWTVEMFGMFYLLKRDIFPLKDLGIIKAINQLYCVDGAPLTTDQVIAISDRWKPYRTVACWYLWRSIDNEAVLY
jgi:DNA-3-methyladenine glycosylase II